LPFLQRALGNFLLIPLALMDQSFATAMTLGRALAHELQGKNALLVASSDLSHFYPQAIANQFDKAVLRRKPAGLRVRAWGDRRRHDRGTTTRCGYSHSRPLCNVGRHHA